MSRSIFAATNLMHAPIQRLQLRRHLLRLHRRTHRQLPSIHNPLPTHRYLLHPLPRLHHHLRRAPFAVGRQRPGQLLQHPIRIESTLTSPHRRSDLRRLYMFLAFHKPLLRNRRKRVQRCQFRLLDFHHTSPKCVSQDSFEKNADAGWQSCED